MVWGKGKKKNFATRFLPKKKPSEREREKKTATEKGRTTLYPRPQKKKERDDHNLRGLLEYSQASEENKKEKKRKKRGTERPPLTSPASGKKRGNRSCLRGKNIPKGGGRKELDLIQVLFVLGKEKVRRGILRKRGEKRGKGISRASVP